MNEMQYNEKIDIWSAGCILYEMAGLEPPFKAKNLISLAKKISKGNPAKLPKFSD